jgi:alkylation response protein AidB-like acyl-CoA dehydrogenase
MSDNTGNPKGGGFLLEKACQREVFLPENLPEDVIAMGQAAYEFVEAEIMPRIDEFEASETKVQTNIDTLKLAGEHGLLMVEVPEEYDGLGMGLTATTYLSERVAQYGSFTVSLLCHCGIGTLPILFFGSAEQKAKYLPKLATGEWLAAYALTEANYGSDALGAKTRAVLTDDGENYILNGEKVYITNGGFADVFTVYAHIDGKFTAFIVDKDMPGVSIGPEEHKMGIKGSSTTSLILEDAVVPVGNLLGEIGKGHKSALNVLNVGRFKLGVGVMGMAKRTVGISSTYANERHQFKQPISNFGMLRRKMADMSASIFKVESMGYRTAGLLEDRVHALDMDDPDYVRKVAGVFEEFDMECSIIKVMGSEVAGVVIDDAVQIHGGYGFIEEYEVARNYRDERINRIFEGTNEVNRLLMPATLMKRSMTGRLPVMPQFMKMVSGLKANPEGALGEFEGPLGDLAKMVESARQQTLYAFGNTLRKNMAQIQKPEFILGKGEYYFEKLANMIMNVYAMDSSVARAQQLIDKNGEEAAANAINLAKIVCFEGASHTHGELHSILASISGGDPAQLGEHMKTVGAITYFAPMDIFAIKEAVAAKIVDLEKYVV